MPHPFAISLPMKTPVREVGLSAFATRTADGPRPQRVRMEWSVGVASRRCKNGCCEPGTARGPAEMETQMLTKPTIAIGIPDRRSNGFERIVAPAARLTRTLVSCFALVLVAFFWSATTVSAG